LDGRFLFEMLCAKASENLHSIKAKYPKKIAFYNVPYLAIESLEVIDCLFTGGNSWSVGAFKQPDALHSVCMVISDKFKCKCFASFQACFAKF